VYAERLMIIILYIYILYTHKCLVLEYYIYILYMYIYMCVILYYRIRIYVVLKIFDFYKNIIYLHLDREIIEYIIFYTSRLLRMPHCY